MLLPSQYFTLTTYSFLANPGAHEALGLIWTSLVSYYCGKIDCGQQNCFWFDIVRLRVKPQPISDCSDTVFIKFTYKWLGESAGVADHNMIACCLGFCAS